MDFFFLLINSLQSQLPHIFLLIRSITTYRAHTPCYCFIQYIGRVTSKPESHTAIILVSSHSISLYGVSFYFSRDHNLPLRLTEMHKSSANITDHLKQIQLGVAHCEAEKKNITKGKLGWYSLGQLLCDSNFTEYNRI